MKTFLKDLLESGFRVIDKKYHTDKTCPLCLQGVNLAQLKDDIKIRLDEIIESSTQKDKFDQIKESFILLIDDRIKRLSSLNDNTLFKNDVRGLKEKLKKLELKYIELLSAAKTEVTSGKRIPDAKNVKIKRKISI